MRARVYFFLRETNKKPSSPSDLLWLLRWRGTRICYLSSASVWRTTRRYHATHIVVIVCRSTRISNFEDENTREPCTVNSCKHHKRSSSIRMSNDILRKRRYPKPKAALLARGRSTETPNRPNTKETEATARARWYGVVQTTLLKFTLRCTRSEHFMCLRRHLSSLRVIFLQTAPLRARIVHEFFCTTIYATWREWTSFRSNISCWEKITFTDDYGGRNALVNHNKNIIYSFKLCPYIHRCPRVTRSANLSDLS